MHIKSKYENKCTWTISFRSSSLCSTSRAFVLMSIKSGSNFSQKDSRACIATIERNEIGNNLMLYKAYNEDRILVACVFARNLEPSIHIHINQCTSKNLNPPLHHKFLLFYLKYARQVDTDSIVQKQTLEYLEYEISQFTEGKCFRWASFLSSPQNTCSIGSKRDEIAFIT